MFDHKKVNCISQLNNDYINAIHLKLSFNMLIFEINFFWDSNINRIFFTKIILDDMINAIFQILLNSCLYLCQVQFCVKSFKS